MELPLISSCSFLDPGRHDQDHHRGAFRGIDLLIQQFPLSRREYEVTDLSVGPRQGDRVGPQGFVALDLVLHETARNRRFAQRRSA